MSLWKFHCQPFISPINCFLAFWLRSNVFLPAFWHCRPFFFYSSFFSLHISLLRPPLSWYLVPSEDSIPSVLLPSTTPFPFLHLWVLLKARLLDSVGKGKGGMIWGNSIETCILPYVKQIASPGSMHETTAQGWCTGMTLRDGLGREVGGGFRMGNTCIPMADSCQCMAETITIL